MNKITTLFPGGFKPLTGAHLALAERYAQHPDTDKVILLIGPMPRDGITREKTIEMFNLINRNPNIIIQPTEFNSPITAAYEYLFNLPQDTQGRFAMAASSKGDDYVRAKTFVPNVDKYKTIGDKKGRMIPPGVDATELNIDVEPLTLPTGQPISASTVRLNLMKNDYNAFRKSYPNQNDAEVKNIWQILKGVQEALFSKEWWSKNLQEDIVEAMMFPREKKRHDDKIKQLRSFLEKHRDKPFIYDFDQFSKTVVGAKLIENIITENYITRDELASIESAVDGFFRKYGIDVNFQGKTTHFLDRLNDPRNEAPIYTDELQDLFQDLADEYGDQIAQQLQQRKPTAIESDYQFDIPIHMPFMLQWNAGKKMIELIPRTIKKQRRLWQQNDPDDILYKIESAMKSNGAMLTEGGAAGHMAHPYDDHSLSFGDVKEIIARALGGYLDIEAAVTEKTDGQNIQVTYKNGQIGFARNKGTVINPMSVQEIQEKFGGRGPISDAFGNAAEDLAEAFTRVNPQTLNNIFKNGRVFANMEIIYPATKNVISYDVAVLQFHNLVEYDEAGNIVETDLTGGGVLQSIIQDANAHLQKTFSFIPPQRIKIGRLEDFEDQQAAFFNEVDQLESRYNLKDTDLVSDYHKAWWADVIREKAQAVGYDIPDSILSLLIARWAFFDKSTSIVAVKKQIDNVDFANWVTEFDKKDFKTYYKQNMEPFESIFLRLGAVVLRNAQNFLAANPSKSAQELKKDLADLIRELQTTNDINSIKKLEHELRRIQRLGGFEAIVPSEGVVFVYGGNTYKLTGAFAPVNQILGVLKYAR